MDAMAWAMDMDQFINCEICFEPYELPQMLPCMHTFCIKCVDKIKQEKHIDCPICKKHCRVQDIKLDFRTAALVDSYQKQLVPESTIEFKDEDSEVKCEACQVLNMNVDHKCETCDLLLCKECEASHRGENSDGDSPHVVKTIASIAGGIKSEIQEILRGLKTEEEIMCVQRSNRHKDLDTINKTCDDAVVKITEQEDKLIANIKKHHDGLRKKVDTEKIKHVQTDKQKYKIVEFSCRDVKDKQVQLNGWLKDLSDMAIVNTAQLIRAKLQQDMIKPQVNENNSASIEQFAAKVIEGDDYDEKRATKVTFSLSLRSEDDKKKKKQDGANGANNYEREEAVSLKPSDYSSAEYRDYNKEKTVTVLDASWNATINNIKEYNNQLYCLSDKNIYVYSKEMALIKTITLGFNSVFDTYNDFIKVQDKYFIISSPIHRIGISLVDAGGNVLQLISHGEFLGAETYEHKLYAYENKLNHVLIFEQTPDYFWKQTAHVDMKYKGTKRCKPHEIKSFHMKNKQMYITDQTSLYHLDIKGTLKRQVDGFNKPYIASVDSKGNLILTEPENSRVVLVKNDSKCSVLKLRGKSSNIKADTVFMGDQNNCVWVSHNADKKICLSMCTPTNIHEIII